MTVKEMIDKLSQLNQNYKIITYDNRAESYEENPLILIEDWNLNIKETVLIEIN